MLTDNFHFNKYYKKTSLESMIILVFNKQLNLKSTLIYKIKNYRKWYTLRDIYIFL